MEHHSTNETHFLYDPELLPTIWTCYVCSCLKRLFVEVEVSIDLGNNWYGQWRPCATHDELLSWFIDSFHDRNSYFNGQGLWITPGPGPYQIRFQRRYGCMPEIQILDSQRRVEWSRSLFLVGIPDKSQSNSHGKSFDPDWVDLQAARRWLSNCVENHGPKCDNTFELFSSTPCTPAYLIDTKQNCIVEGAKASEYVALSYRWGRPDFSFRTNKSNFPSLCVPEGITKQTRIPITITHALHVVRSLGERYLWVDSLCIISDDKKHFQEQLQIMGSIYTCAKLTIVSADGDAWDGLHGIENVSRRRRLPNIFTWLGGTKLVVRDFPALSAIHSRYERGSTDGYFLRGWTFQEYILSRRRLIFGKRQIHWRCSCAMLHEDRPNDAQHPDDLPPIETSLNMSNIFAGIPDVREFEQVANEYHMRGFTHDEDALPGITGLLNLLKYSFRGGFLCGLPMIRFDAALMWHCGLPPDRPKNGFGAVAVHEARVTSANQNSDLPGAILPSWSWVSWMGRDLRIMHEEQSYQLPSSIRNATTCGERKYVTTPITTWYSHDTPFSHEKWPICSYPERTENLTDQGWVVEPFDPAKHFRDGQNYRQNPELGLGESALAALEPAPDKVVYHHPDLPNKFFWRPFSKSTRGRQHDQHTEAYELEQRPYISCRTQRNWFHARRISRGTYMGRHLYYEALGKSIWDVSFDAQIVVVDDSNRVCGWLQVPGEPSDKEFQDGPSWPVHIGGINLAFEDAALANMFPLRGSKIELVAICCREPSIIHGMDETAWKFYGVLWVEWKDKVAYRRGCGYINKGMWDESGAEEVDLVLG